MKIITQRSQQPFADEGIGTTSATEVRTRAKFNMALLSQRGVLLQSTRCRFHPAGGAAASPKVESLERFNTGALCRSRRGCDFGSGSRQRPRAGRIERPRHLGRRKTRIELRSGEIFSRRRDVTRRTLTIQAGMQQNTMKPATQKKFLSTGATHGEAKRGPANKTGKTSQRGNMWTIHKNRFNRSRPSAGAVVVFFFSISCCRQPRVVEQPEGARWVCGCVDVRSAETLN